MKFCRIFDLSDGSQVLYTIESGESEDGSQQVHELVVRTDFEVVSMSLIFGFNSHEDAHSAMMKQTDDSALKFRDQMRSFLDNPKQLNDEG